MRCYWSCCRRCLCQTAAAEGGNVFSPGSTPAGSTVTASIETGSDTGTAAVSEAEKAALAPIPAAVGAAIAGAATVCDETELDSIKV